MKIKELKKLLNGYDDEEMEIVMEYTNKDREWFSDDLYSVHSFKEIFYAPNFNGTKAHKQITDSAIIESGFYKNESFDETRLTEIKKCLIVTYITWD